MRSIPKFISCGIVLLALLGANKVARTETASTSYTTPGDHIFGPVPAGVRRITFDAYGAQGGAGSSGVGGGAGGLGGRATVTIDVSAGQYFLIKVGGQGGVETGGFNGGGYGGHGDANGSNGGGGGGASTVLPYTPPPDRSGPITNGVIERILVAGGGGGGGAYSCGGAGGAGGGSAGNAGADGFALTTPGGGGGGTQSGGGAGGALGYTGAYPDENGSPGEFLTGGRGGHAYYSGGGGGGGGYYGGGGGGTGYCGAGGGGGSGYGPDGVDFVNGVQSGNGQIIVSYTQPDVVINQSSGQSDPTNETTVHFTAVFTSPVTGFGSGGVSLSGSAGATTAGVTQIAPNDGTTYDVAVSGMTGDGTVIAAVVAGAAVDGNNNENTASTSTDNEITVDITRPSVTINKASGQSDPTNASPIHFTAVFSERVTGFDEVNLTGNAGATSSSVTEITPNDGTSYDVAVSGMAQPGAVVASILQNVATDARGNGNTASTSTDNSVDFDNVRPNVTIEQASGQSDPTNASPVHFTAHFTEPVLAFATGDVTVSGSAGATTATVTQVAPNDGTTYDVAVSGMTGNGTVIAAIAAGVAADAATNGNNASTSTDNTVTYDASRPTVTINQASGQSDPTNASPIHFTVVFSEPVSGFINSDVTLSGTASPTTRSVTETAPNNGTTYDVAVSGMTANGTVIASIAANVAVDLGNNGNNASTSTDNTVTFSQSNPNLVGNSEFDSGVTGWTNYGSAVLSRVSGGHNDGASNFAMQVRGTSSSSFGCDDEPNWITRVASLGARYRISAWVRSATGHTGRIKIRLYEYAGSSQVGSTAYSNEPALSPSWQLLTLDYVVRQTGTTLSMRITDATGNQTFLVDDVSIELLQGPSTFTIVSSAGAGGTISPLGSRTVSSGGSQTYSIVPSNGFHIDRVLVDNASVGTPASYTFTNVTANHTIEARFAANTTNGNLVGNPGFDSDLNGWTTYGSAVLSRVPGGHTSGPNDFAMQIRGTSSSSFGCDDQPDWIARVASLGAVYRIRAWVRSATGHTGQVKIRLYEYDGSSQVGSTAYSNEPALTSSWQLLTLDYTVRRAGTHLSLRVTDASGNQTFLVDDVSITLLSSSLIASETDASRGSPSGVEFRAQVAPNPARGAAVLRFGVTRRGPLSVRLFDVSGRVRSTLLDENEAAPGERSLVIGRGGFRVEPGVYFYRVVGVEGVLQGRVTILD
jgi:predicted heme/steroid binding protein